jgi:RHS repeat-associated protein
MTATLVGAVHVWGVEAQRHHRRGSRGEPAVGSEETEEGGALTYLGLGTVVKRAHPQNAIDQTFIKLAAEPTGDAGDPYTGLDRFGRIVDHRWLNSVTGVATDHFQYGLDRNGNRLYRDNLLNDAFDELYHANGPTEGYDPLNQLIEFQRGPLSDTNGDNIPDTVVTASRSQAWSPDALGNFNTVTTDGTGQARTHNAQNEITSIAGATTPTYDANGNLTTDETGRQLVFDPWNRLVRVKTSGGSTITVYAYDALGRRVSENPGSVRDFYYTAAWQVAEERVGGVTRVQYVWSPVYVDALVLRDRDADSNGTLEERLYAQQDANWNVTAVINTAGVVVERRAQDQFGLSTYYAADWTPLSDTTVTWVYGHQGLRHEALVGLIDNRIRFETPTLMRFVSPDPERFAAGYSSFYVYVGNNPGTMLDPSGLMDFRLLSPFLGGAAALPFAPAVGVGVLAAGAAVGAGYVGWQVGTAAGEALPEAWFDSGAQWWYGVDSGPVTAQQTAEALRRLKPRPVPEPKPVPERRPKPVPTDIGHDRDKNKCRCKFFVEDAAGAVGTYPGPYAFLEGSDGTVIKQGKDFTPTQRIKIRANNKARHGGTGMYSDDPKDPVKGPLAHPEKPVWGNKLPVNEDGLQITAQVDHIHPQITGGSNSYCNAQLVSLTLNEMKRFGKYPK